MSAKENVSTKGLTVYVFAHGRRTAHNAAMDMVIWLIVVIALIAGAYGYGRGRGWGGRGPGSFDWWREGRRRRGWWW